MKTWLITGATGLLGANAGVHLANRARVVGACRHPREMYGYNTVLGVDLTDSRAITDLIEREQPDVVLHAAALASHEGCERDPELAHIVNVEATGHVAQACAAVGATLIYVSTDAVFDGTRGRYREDDVPSPFSEYGRTKLKGEEVALATCADCIVARTNFFGWSPSGVRSILEFFVNSLRNQTMVNGYTDFVVSSVYAPHLMAMLEDLAAGANRGTVHATVAEGGSKYEFGIDVAETFGLKDSLILPVESSEGLHATRRDRDLSLDTTRLEAWLGRAVPSQHEGVIQSARDEQSLTRLIRQAWAASAPPEGAT